ncbi:MAG: nucleoside-triphosphatase [Lentihominibacter sp.]
MYKHLFLEGPIQKGKSTLLRELLSPYMNEVGGFTSQRLLDSEGKTVAFRIGSARNTPLTAPYDENYNGIFRVITTQGQSLKYPEVFENEGLRYLTNNKGKKLILLDEIGGAELLSYCFRKELYNLLSGDTPCIGVIKQEVKAKFMSATAGYEKNLLSYNRELRKLLISKYGGKILQFKRNDENLKREIEDFLYRIFTTD